MNRLKTHILHALESGESIALATILGLSGSAPRTRGTQMMVRRDGSIEGTIGGGRLEAEIIQAGLEALRRDECFVQHFDLTGNNAHDMDMICGGALDVLVEPLTGEEQTLGVFRAFCRLWESRQELLLGTVLQQGPQGMNSKRFLVQWNTTGPVFLPCAPLNSQALLPLLDKARTDQSPTSFQCQGMLVVLEPVPTFGAVHIFGAGHVAREVASLAQRMEFRVEVYDDRPEYANRERFPDAAIIHVPETFFVAVDERRMDEDSYVVIVTRGHKHDMDILAQALRTGAGYIGMIGSRRRRDIMYAALLEQGVTQADLNRVHCPIGLNIHAETSSEIALSIVAELVAARALRRSDRRSNTRAVSGPDTAGRNCSTLNAARHKNP